MAGISEFGALDVSLTEANRRLAAQGKPPVTAVNPSSITSPKVWEDKTATLSSEQTRSMFTTVNGPLEKLESSIDEFSEKYLRYPNNLGTDANYSGRYAMRILIYKQSKSPLDAGVISQLAGSPFDREKKASQQGRVNYTSFTVSGELLEDSASKGAAALVLGAKGFANAGKTVLKDVPIVGAIAEGAQTLALASVAESATERLGSGSRANLTDPLAFIHLYMPEQLNFVDRHDYDAVSVTDALGVQGLLAQGNPTELLGRIGERASVFGINLLGQNFTELALFNSGLALNPQLELLYRKTNNREFVFNFRFVPSNAKDAQTIEDVIRTLRYHASPEFTTSSDNVNSRYMIPPSLFEVEFITMEDGSVAFNNRLPRIASCVLSNIDVNYAPSGQFSAFNGDYPVETQLQLTFTETVILTKKDVKIGY